ncbi:DUF4231 domain-containing protein [Oxalicibacterium faecigallinarum]|uniref:DUF4231 domain-containing protein n=1 Tax=Oxalicibacterium faecigallinarum TaxID=573741 RepID=A0A8J3AXT5_9BURK|nr:DUF4231 domain-containing protein [Oxalicibacterium faecigallinarum]GGI18273.1 hypothetical protein GCM10008066_13180 [Oxalicibacterium faecigallinarum]
MQKKSDVPPQLESRMSAENFCVDLIEGFKKKATHNKEESMLCFWASMGGALLVPFFVTLGRDIGTAVGCDDAIFWLEKVIPSLLSVCVAFSTGWLQLRKPQQLWSLYRTSQRELEDNLQKFRFAVGEYAVVESSEKLLIERVTKIALDAHYAWLPMVPNPEKIA